MVGQGDCDPEQGQHKYLTMLKPLRDRLARDFKTKSAAECMLLDVIVHSYYLYMMVARVIQSATTSDGPVSYDVLSQQLLPMLSRANQQFLRNPKRLEMQIELIPE